MSMNKNILDPCCGSRMFWIDKQNTNAVYMDIRHETFTVKDKSTRTGFRDIHIAPDVIGDVTNMPFPDESFSLIIFDPPHLLHAGKSGWLAKKYGVLPTDWQGFFKKSFAECFRVLKRGGTCVFKWSEKDLKVQQILNLIPWKPIVGQLRGHDTKWFVFYRSL